MINVFIPTINRKKADKYAELMMLRAGMDCDIYILEDSEHKRGWVWNINNAKKSFPAEFYVYAADDAYPGRNWLLEGYNSIQKHNAGLLGFNEGKYQELNAGFGLVRHSWIEEIYGGNLLYPGYKSHYADPEITIVAKAQKKFVYNPRAVFVEVVFNKDGKNAVGNDLDDENLFFERMEHGFDGKVRPMIRSIVG